MKTWSKTRVQGLMRHKTGNYYARLFVGGKEKWVSLKTHSLEVAKGKMRSDEEVSDVRDAQERKEEIRAGKMTVETAMELYKKHLAHRVVIKKIKPSTEEFWHTALNSIRLSWPKLAEADVSDITAAECKSWFASFASENSPTYSNNVLHALKKVFEQALDKGVIFRNPLSRLERVSIRATKLELPSRQQFHAIVQKVRASGHRTAKDAGDTIEFLAYSGCRIGEARRVLWEDCDFVKGQIAIKGDPETGTKNWQVRHVPMIPAQRVLLKRMTKHHSPIDPKQKVLRVTDVRGSLGPSAIAVGAPNITHHDLRHLFATTCIEGNVDIPTVANWLGHKDGGALAMKVYGHLRTAHSQASAEKVDFTAGGKPTS
jgi:integrase